MNNLTIRIGNLWDLVFDTTLQICVYPQSLDAYVEQANSQIHNIRLDFHLPAVKPILLVDFCDWYEIFAIPLKTWLLNADSHFHESI